MVGQVIGSRKATPAVLNFIAATRVSKRAHRQKLEMEKQERKRVEAWGLDKNRLEEDEEGIVGGERGDKEKHQGG